MGTCWIFIFLFIFLFFFIPLKPENIPNKMLPLPLASSGGQSSEFAKRLLSSVTSATLDDGVLRAVSSTVSVRDAELAIAASTALRESVEGTWGPGTSGGFNGASSGGGIDLGGSNGFGGSPTNAPSSPPVASFHTPGSSPVGYAPFGFRPGTCAGY